MTEIGGTGGPSRAGGDFWNFLRPKGKAGRPVFGFDSARLSASARRFVQSMKTLAGKALGAIGPKWPEQHHSGPRVEGTRQGAGALGPFAQRMSTLAGVHAGSMPVESHHYRCPRAIDTITRGVNALELDGVITPERAMLWHHRVQYFENVVALGVDARKYPEDPQAFVERLLRDLAKAEKRAPAALDPEWSQTVRKAAEEFQAVIRNVRASGSGRP